MIKMCKVCGEYFNTTLRGRYKYCSEKCAKIGNRININEKKRVSTIRDISTLKFNEPMQVELEGDGYADGELVLEQTKWIPVSERLPDKPYGCIVTVMDTSPIPTYDDFESIYPDFVGWDGENWNDADGYSIPFEVIAWMPLPQPYKAENEG